MRWVLFFYDTAHPRFCFIYNRSHAEAYEYKLRNHHLDSSCHFATKEETEEIGRTLLPLSSWETYKVFSVEELEGPFLICEKLLDKKAA